ncbi:hypothetical protein, variant [Aphanomyces astaci]|uniref:Uncharacterized protein n=1 Tax=Aphanomyces astaci TaxID=112090 RepID=W4FUL3_APHAT|nr:hypothetical protein, variant [Aphanomyces astaci]ETV71185.1 hypothetical protein, variant [Aphanomyces astaci]|eukprot:XP_009839431.1 hypothetical protein, variant [Aphanomyces astaci]
MMAQGTPFGNLMAEAVKLKGAQQATLRPVWDSWPQYFQHSMFMQDPIVSGREKPFDERLRLATEIKVQGNVHFAKGEFEEAVAQYEKALALFKYCENTDPDWKKKGIRDDDIYVVDYKPDNVHDQSQLDTLKVTLYLNISVCKLKLKEFALAISACGDVLAIDPTNAKAYYRRAQALITPLSCGAVEFEKALVDLETACHHDPDNVECRNLYRRLRLEHAQQRKLDKRTFSGMFNRGTVVDDTNVVEVTAPDKARANEKRLQKEVEDAEAIAHMYEQSGKLQEASELRQKIDQAKAATRATPPRVDFMHPTPEMIEDGKKNGIDLTDKRVQQMLADLQDEHLANGTTPKQSATPPPSGATKFQEALGEADEILKTMTNQEISQLLQSEGIDFHSITDKDMLNEMVRNVLATKLRDMPRPGDEDTAAASDKTTSRSMRHIFALVGLWVLFRMYSSGGFAMLVRGLHALTFGDSTPLRPLTSADSFDDFDEF